MEPSIFQFVGGTVANASAAFLEPVADVAIGAVMSVVAVGVSLWVLIVGLLIVGGYIERPLASFAGKALRVLIVTAVALSADAYGSLVVDAVEGLEQLLARALNVPGSAEGSIYQVLDQAFGAGLDLVSRCFAAADNASWRRMGTIIGWSLAGLIIAFGTVVVTLLGGGVIVVAKFALILMVAIGPLFVVCLIWPATVRYFDAWVGQVVNFTLVVSIVALVMAFSTVAFTQFVAAADLDGGSSPIVVALEVLVLTLLLGWITLQVQSWSAGLSGGMTSAVLTLRHMGAPARALGSAGSGARNVIDPRSTRRDLESGHMVSARRMNHLVAGNTLANPAYRQHVREQLGRNWSRARGGNIQSKG